jgi:hypothetical protein
MKAAEAEARKREAAAAAEERKRAQVRKGSLPLWKYFFAIATFDVFSDFGDVHNDVKSRKNDFRPQCLEITIVEMIGCLIDDGADVFVHAAAQMFPERNA